LLRAKLKLQRGKGGRKEECQNKGRLRTLIILSQHNGRKEILGNSGTRRREGVTVLGETYQHGQMQRLHREGPRSTPTKAEKECLTLTTFRWHKQKIKRFTRQSDYDIGQKHFPGWCSA